MSNTYVPPSLDDIRARLAEHLVTVRGSSLIVVNYTAKTQYDRRWDDVTLQCRGLILAVDPPWPRSTRIVDVVALPFTKFFNVGEIGEGFSSPVVEVTEKLDGALGILYRSAGSHFVATRGSFTSEQAQWASAYLKRYDLNGLPDHLTLLFEIIFPGSRVVVDYAGREDLVLLGVRNCRTGEDWFYPRVAELGQAFGLAVVPTATSIQTLDHALQARESLPADQEGWVIRCADGQRWKVKGETYRQIHRFISHLSERAVLDALAGGTFDLLAAATPELYRSRVTTWRGRIQTDLDARLTELHAICAIAPRETRKDFALWVKERHPRLAPYLFALLDGKDPTPQVYAAIRETLSPEPLVDSDEG